MSATPSIGLVGVSTQTRRVPPGTIAPATAAGSLKPTAVCSIPHGPKTRAMSRYVPPYAASGTTTWSPGRSTARSRVSSTASPEANAKPRSPLSAVASAVSNAVRVGLADREYS